MTFMEEAEDEATLLIAEAILSKRFTVDVARRLFLVDFPNQDAVFDEVLEMWDSDIEDKWVSSTTKVSHIHDDE